MTSVDRATETTETTETAGTTQSDVTLAFTPRDLAFMALIAGVILAILRRVFRRQSRQREG